MERIQAARWAGYTPSDFFELDPDWMALVVAAYRTDRRIEGVMREEENKKIKKQRSKSGTSRKPSRRGRRGR